MQDSSDPASTNPAASEKAPSGMALSEMALSEMAELDELLSGTPYRAIELLGRGGVGEVYAVEHELLGRRFALKRLHPYHVATPGVAERLRLEAQSLGRLQHPNIVEVIDSWLTPQGLPCLVLELLEGKTLARELRARRRLPVDDAVNVCRQLLSGLGAAHALGIIHRDMKPENVFLHRQAGFEAVVKILDFGLARVLLDCALSTPRAQGEIRTTTGALVGSPRYMSPEAKRRERVDHRADLYGVGLLLYEMLTNAGPYDRGPGPTVPPSQLAAEVSPELDAVVLRAIHPNRDDRFQSAQDFLGALKATAPPRTSPTSWRPSPGWIGNQR